jgi:hypothetical protein
VHEKRAHLGGMAKLLKHLPLPPRSVVHLLRRSLQLRLQPPHGGVRGAAARRPPPRLRLLRLLASGAQRSLQLLPLLRTGR